MSVDTAIGLRVHSLMWQNGITQAQVGRLLGIDQSAVSRKLRGKTPWKVSELVAVAGLLHVPPADLMDAA